jgi:DNA-binding winged helix-turn-helix (wHTH) protein/TolB-like protein/Tfp pilus assembly protein PilF
MREQRQGLYEFDLFCVDTGKRLLLRQGEPVPLKPKVFETLLVLVQNSGRVLDKDELMQTIWPDTIVEENNLTQNISAIRKALGERRDEHRYVVTVPGRGYRFVADVREPHVEDKNGDHARGNGTFKVQPSIEGASTPQAEWIAPQAVTQAEIQEELKEYEKEKDDAQNVLALQMRARRRFRWIGGIALLVFTLLISFVVVLPRLLRSSGESRVAETDQAVKSIAVLPFKPLGAEAEEYIGPGMADALITKLSNTGQITVRSTSAVLRYNKQSQDPLAAGRELGVDSVLDGKIQRVGERVRVTVQLVRVSDGASLWAQTFDEKFTDIFAMQDSISEQVTKALTLQLSRDERERMLKRYTENTEAYQAFLKGRYFLDKRTAASFKKAMEYFQQAIGHDQNFALAYVGLSDCYHRLVQFAVMSPAEGIPKANAAVTKALSLDNSLAEAHATLGVISFRFLWDFPTAERELKRAIELDPRYATAHMWYALYLQGMNKLPESEQEMELAAKLDPLSVTINNALADYYFQHRQYDRALEQYRKTLELDPSFPSATGMIGRIYEQKGMYKEALAQYEKVAVLTDNKNRMAVAGYTYAISGRKDEARKVLDELLKRSQQTYMPPYSIAVIYLGLGEKDNAFVWLEKAYDDHSLTPGPLLYDPRLDNLRSDPRYQDLLKRIGLPPR